MSATGLAMTSEGRLHISDHPQMIDIEALTFVYNPGLAIFRDFNWHVGRGESWAILGPSGCGKTTLLYLIAGLLSPSQGQVCFEGENITRPRPHTGLILQDYGLLPWATVQENAALGLKVRSFYGPDGKHAPPDFDPSINVDHWVKRLGLSEHAEKFPNQISGGQRQRTAIARTLALEPDLLLMDEPFASLDAPTREGLQLLTLELAREARITLVIVTHSIEEAVFMGQKILFLSIPPITQATVIDNPASGSPEFRDSAGYQVLCRSLRSQMEAL
jgi:NitT/TauT family transport system ATP-binding protein